MDKRISSIGTNEYFRWVTHGTLFESVEISGTGEGISAFMREMGRRALEKLSELEKDLDRNRAMIKFFSDQERYQLNALIENLDGILRLTGSSTVQINAVTRIMDAQKMPPGMIMHHVRMAAQKITGNFSGSVGIQERERISAVRDRLDHPLSFSRQRENTWAAQSRPGNPFPFSSSNLPSTQEFPDELFESFDRDTLVVALEYIEFQSPLDFSNPLREPLGSDGYAQHMAAYVLGGDFVRSAHVGDLKDWAGLINKQARKIINEIRDHLSNQDFNFQFYNLIIEDETCGRLIRFTEEVARYGSCRPLTERDLAHMLKAETPPGQPSKTVPDYSVLEGSNAKLFVSDNFVRLYAPSPFDRAVKIGAGFIPIPFAGAAVGGVESLMDSIYNNKPVGQSDALSDITALGGAAYDTLDVLFKNRGIGTLGYGLSFVDAANFASGYSNTELEYKLSDIMFLSLMTSTEREAIDRFALIKAAAQYHLDRGDIEIYTYEGPQKKEWNDVLGVEVTYYDGSQYFRALNAFGKNALFFPFTYDVMWYSNGLSDIFGISLRDWRYITV